VASCRLDVLAVYVEQNAYLVTGRAA